MKMTVKSFEHHKVTAIIDLSQNKQKLIRIDAQSDCTGRPDGPCCAGCHSYTQCTGGVGQTIECPLPDYAYNELIGGCDLMDDTPPPCGKNRNCANLPDNKYPDMTAGQICEAFFTCSGGINLGATPCNPPDSPPDLVFYFPLQGCDWRYNVPPPCGTLGESPQD